MKLIKSCIFLYLLFIISCVSNGKDNKKYDIEQLYQNMATAFLSLDPTQMIDFYHSDFLNDGIDLFEEEIFWEDLMTEYHYFSIANLDINLKNDYYAETTFQIIFDDSVTFNIPEDITSLGYVHLDNEGNWKIYGNQKR